MARFLEKVKEKKDGLLYGAVRLIDDEEGVRKHIWEKTFDKASVRDKEVDAWAKEFAKDLKISIK